MTHTDTRRRVLDVALACFLADGYEQTTIARDQEAQRGLERRAVPPLPEPRKPSRTPCTWRPSPRSRPGCGIWSAASPGSLRDAVRGAIAHQLTWTEQHPDLARFVYARGHLDWNSPARCGARGAQPGPRGGVPGMDGPAGAQRRGTPGTDAADHRRGERPRARDRAALAGRPGGPAADLLRGRAHRRRLRGPARHPAERRGTRRHTGGGATRHAPPVPARGRVTLELLADDGSVLARGQASAQLSP